MHKIKRTAQTIRQKLLAIDAVSGISCPSDAAPVHALSRRFKAERGDMKKRIGYYVILMCVCLSAAGCARRDDMLESSDGLLGESMHDERSSEESTGILESIWESGHEESTRDASDNDKAHAGDDDGLVGRAVDVLTRIWDSYTDEDRFSAAGGDYDNTVTNGPGTFDITNKEGLSTQLIFPAENADMIDDAASLMHMMNSNTFTGGVYHVTDTANVQTLADALKDKIENTQWVCGYPDRLIIADIGDGYVLSAFGEEEIMQTFKERLTDTYGDSKILYEQKLSE